VGRPRKWSAAERETALRLYVEMGPTEAAKVTGIDKSLITRWAQARGLTLGTVAKAARTAAATEAIAARRRLKRLQAMEEIADAVLDALRQTNEPHVEYVGQAGRKVMYPKAPPSALLAYATTIEKNIGTLQKLAEAEEHAQSR